MTKEWIAGRKVLVTGGSSGIGFETARALAQSGALVVIASRDADRTADAAQFLSRETGERVSGMHLDLSSQQAVRGFASRFRADHPYLDVLVNNAGAYFVGRRESVDGIEMTWALNHLGPFLLTAELMPLLRITEGARIVTVASEAHSGGKLILDDVERRKSYSGFSAYSQSKLANIMFTYALARRLEGTGVTANCLHPGVVASGFLRGLPIMGAIASKVTRFFMISEAEGARTCVHLASSPEAAGQSGGYYDKSAPAVSSKASRDADDQERLWDLSVKQTDADFGF